jgi:hypothetical protein
MIHRFLKLAILLCVVFTSPSLLAQITKVSKNQRSADVHEFYRFQAIEQDTYSIRIIDPHGQITAMPVKKKSLSPGAQAEFSFSTKHWKEGSYQIVAEGSKGNRVIKRIRISGQPDKKGENGQGGKRE